MGAPAVLELEGLHHRLYDPARRQEFVIDVEGCLAVYAGEFVTVVGPNACGKTTLLSVLGLLRRPSHPETLRRFVIRAPGPAGPVSHAIVEEWRHPRRIEELRRRHLGFALQSGELVPELTVAENIAVPMRLGGAPGRACRERVAALLAGFGLGAGLARSRVHRLSGGEYQRVALARAIAHRPALVFVDEPTASLNPLTAREALGQLRALQQESGERAAVVMITHDAALAREFSDRIVRMESLGATAGRVAAVEENAPGERGV